MLLQRIENARARISGGRLLNEAAVSSGVVLPILDALGWPVFDPAVVAPEHGVGGRRVGFALLNHGRPAVFVEVKQPGQGVGADRQLFEYAFHEGVPLAILTDGATWHFYLPAMQGSYEERRVYLLDIIEREPAESAERLVRYLDREAVASGEAFERARHDYQRSRQRREAREGLPAAWQQLVDGADERLLDLLAAEVESRSGYRPEVEDVFGFLAALHPPPDGAAPRPVPRPRSRTTRPPPPPAVTEAPSPSLPAESDTLPGVGFIFNGTFVSARSGRDVLTKVFQALADRDPSFLGRFVDLPEHGRTRRYVTRRREDLYPNTPGLWKESVEVQPGYWLGLNVSHSGSEGIIRMACKAAGVRFGEDLKVRLA